jgi:hypothetical protein
MLLINIEGYENAEGLLPGKCFEYLACRLPILGIGPFESDLGQLLGKVKAGRAFTQDDEVKIGEYISNVFHAWRSGTVGVNSESIYMYSRKSLTEALVRIIGGALQK